MNHLEYLGPDHLDACDEGLAFAAGYPTLKAAWNACPIADWLIWLVMSAAYDKRFKGEIEWRDINQLRVICKNVNYQSCDYIRAALSCPEVPE